MSNLYYPKLAAFIFIYSINEYDYNIDDCDDDIDDSWL